eukprot:34641-Amphidinium_carterae.1
MCGQLHCNVSRESSEFNFHGAKQDDKNLRKAPKTDSKTANSTTVLCKLHSIVRISRVARAQGVAVAYASSQELQAKRTRL